MNIFVDMDNTICNFIEAFALKCNELFKTKFDYSTTRLEWEHGWDLSKSLFPGSTAEERKKIYETVFSSPGFWLDMNPIEDSIESVERLSKDNKVFILTAPWPSSISCYIEKYYWIKKHFGFIDLANIIYCSDKSLIKSDMLIDDKPSYLTNNQFDFTVAYEYKFNSHLRKDVDFMSSSWIDIADWIKEKNENRN